MRILTKDETNMLNGGGENSVDTRTRRNDGGRGASTLTVVRLTVASATGN